MPFIPLTPESQAIRRGRILIAGTLGVGKTTAIVRAFQDLRAVNPDTTMAYLSFPGEKGYGSVPVLDGLTARIWEDASGMQSHKVIKEVEDELVRLMTLGPTILAGDGFHKLFNYILDAVTDGAYFQGDAFEQRLYGRAYTVAGDMLSRMFHSKVPLVFISTWVRGRAERNAKPGEQARDIPQKLYPDFPPGLARVFVGEFDVAVMQTLRSAPTMNPEGLYAPELVVKLPLKEKIRVWQTRAHGEVEGVTLKAPVNVSKRIPTFIPASYSALQRIWVEAEATK